MYYNGDDAFLFNRVQTTLLSQKKEIYVKKNSKLEEENV